MQHFSHLLVKNHRALTSEVHLLRYATFKNAAAFRNWTPIKERYQRPPICERKLTALKIQQIHITHTVRPSARR